MGQRVRRGDKLDSRMENAVRTHVAGLLRSTGVNMCVDSSGIHMRANPTQVRQANSITITIDGGGAVLSSTNPTLDGATVEVPYACTLASWTVEGDAAGSVVVDVLRANRAVPTASIVGSGNKPTLGSAQYASAVPSGWTSIALAQGDIIGFAVISATTVKRVTVTLRVA